MGNTQDGKAKSDTCEDADTRALRATARGEGGAELLGESRG